MIEQQDVGSNDTTGIKPATAICEETPCDHNALLAEKRRLAGYDIEQLIDKASPTDILFLQYTGKLPPTDEHRRLLEMLSIYLSTPSPKEPAAQAAIAARTNKVNTESVLPMALMSGGGLLSGAAEVELCTRFLIKHQNDSPTVVANQLIEQWQFQAKPPSEECHAEHHVVPGFGRLHNDIDVLTGRILYKVAIEFPQGRQLAWAVQFNKAMSDFGLGILEVGLTSVVCSELELTPRASVGLYQLFKSSGLFAYGMG